MNMGEVANQIVKRIWVEGGNLAGHLKRKDTLVEGFIGYGELSIYCRYRCE